MVNTRQFSGSTYMQDMTKSHTFSAKNQGSTYTPIRLIRREIRYLTFAEHRKKIVKITSAYLQAPFGLAPCHTFSTLADNQEKQKFKLQ